MTQTKFRFLVIASVLAAAAGAIFDLVLSPASEAATQMSAWEMTGLGAVALLIIITIGLWRFSWWARPAALFFTIAGVISALFLVQLPSPPLAEALYQASALLTGAMIAAAYWSSISDRFDRG